MQHRNRRFLVCCLMTDNCQLTKPRVKGHKTESSFYNIAQLFGLNACNLTIHKYDGNADKNQNIFF